MKYNSFAFCSQVIHRPSKNFCLHEMLKFSTKMHIFHLIGSQIIPCPLLHLVYFQIKFVWSSQVCRFSFQRCRTLLRVGDQNIHYHHAALILHYPVLCKWKKKEMLQKGTLNTLLSNLCILASFLSQDRSGMASHIQLLLKDPFHRTADTSQTVNFGPFVLSVSPTVTFP